MVPVEKVKIQRKNSTTYMCTQHAGAQHICAQHTHKAGDRCKGGKPPAKRWTVEEDHEPPALSGRPPTKRMTTVEARGRQQNRGTIVKAGGRQHKRGTIVKAGGRQQNGGPLQRREAANNALTRLAIVL